MDVDRNTITKYEKGERLPSLEYFYRFCIKFDLSMDEIMFSKTKKCIIAKTESFLLNRRKI